jgi:hypothetical protein
MTRSEVIWWQRFLVWPASLVIVSVAAVVLGLAMVSEATGSDFTSTGKVTIAIALPAVILAVYAINLSPWLERVIAAVGGAEVTDRL